MTGRRELPAPGSGELKKALPNRVAQRWYEELYNHPEGLTIEELKREIPEYAGQTHFDRRGRSLNVPFILERKWEGGRMIYRLGGTRENSGATGRISNKVAAQVKFRDGSRCQMCGKGVEDGIKLEVDHRIPLDWGGSNDIDNLWTLCQEDNHGKKAYFASLNEYTNQIRAAASQPSVHRRLGELLRAFGIGNPVPSYLLQLVASARQYNEDWQRRLRELRELGWDYTVTKRRENGRIVSYYSLKTEGGWPGGSGDTAPPGS
jgi:5-methylcytosine-specific restriction endonuclease McrA